MGFLLLFFLFFFSLQSKQYRVTAVMMWKYRLAKILVKNNSAEQPNSKGKHLSWTGTAWAINEGRNRSLFGKITKEIHCFSLSMKLDQLTQCFQLGEHKLFILNRFSAKELAACMWSPWNCFVLRVYFPLAYIPQPMHKLCSVWFVRDQRLWCEISGTTDLK